MKKITKILTISALVLALATVFSSCRKGTTIDGFVNMKITGAPSSPTFYAAYLMDTKTTDGYEYAVGCTFPNGNSGETSGFVTPNGWWNGGGSYYVLIVALDGYNYSSWISNSKVSFTTGTKTIAWSQFETISLY